MKFLFYSDGMSIYPYINQPVLGEQEQGCTTLAELHDYLEYQCDMLAEQDNEITSELPDPTADIFPSVPRLAKNDIQFIEQIFNNPSTIVFQARWNKSDVAVKQVTSIERFRTEGNFILYVYSQDLIQNVRFDLAKNSQIFYLVTILIIYSGSSTTRTLLLC